MRAFFYTKLMRLAHRYKWHHITTSRLENGDLRNRCDWCGLTEILKHDHFGGVLLSTDSNCPKNEIMLTNILVPGSVCLSVGQKENPLFEIPYKNERIT